MLDHAPASFRRARVRLAAFGCSVLLAACGGGGGDDAGGGLTQHQAGPHEFTQCVVPQAVRFSRELDNGQWRTRRAMALPGEPLLPFTAATGVTTKNPEGVLDHGPLFARNCIPGTPTATQRMRLRVRTQDFFTADVGDHLAFGARGVFPTLNRAGEEQVDGIGVILHRSWGGALAERYRRPGGNAFSDVEPPQVTLRDGATYLIEMQAGATTLAWRVTDESTGQSTGQRQFTAPADFAPLGPNGFFLAVLCQDQNARCEAPQRGFQVDVFDIEVAWLP